MALDAQGLNPDVAIQVQTHYVACALAEAGCGEAIVDAITVRAMLRPGMVVRRLDPPLKVPLSILTRTQDPLSALHREFIERLRQRSEEHTSELQSLMRSSYAVFCLKKKSEEII